MITPPGGSISRVDGTATPLGPWYSGISKHYFDYVTTVSGSSNFSILIATGSDRSNRIQEIAISSYLIHPTLDFALLKHESPVYGAAIPVFGTVARLDIVRFAGFGDRYLFLASAFVNDGNPSAFNIQVTGTSNPARFGLGSRFVTSIPGGGAGFDSSSPGYNSANALCLFLQQGVPHDPRVPSALGGALPFVVSGLSTFIQANTPLNSEPTLTLERVNGAIRLTWTVAAIGWRLQTSSNLGTWSDIGVTLTAPGTLDDPIGNRPRQFYRLFNP